MNSIGNAVPPRAHQRLDYLDVTKGILIIAVVLYHVPFICLKNGTSGTATIKLLSDATVWYTTFFMQAFFFITGRCSNFNKPWLRFVWKDIRTILIPAFILALLAWVFICHNISVLWPKANINWICSFGFKWFFPALFLGKELLWLVLRINKRYMQIIPVVILFAVGLYWARNGMRHNWFYFCNALILLPTMWLGNVYRNCSTTIFEKISIPVFIVGYIITRQLHLFPYVMAKVSITYTNFALYFLLSTTGTLAVIFLGRLLHRFSLLSFIGKHTLYIYALHWSIFLYLINKLGFIADKPHIFNSLTLMILFALVTILLSIAVEYVWIGIMKGLSITFKAIRP